MTGTGRYELHKKNIIRMCILIVFCFTLVSCSSSADEEDCMKYLDPENVENILGKEKQDILTIFETVIDNKQTDTEEIILNKELIYKEKAVTVTLMFENNILFRLQYNFASENETAFEFINEAYALFTEKYGESDTYPGLSDRINGLTFEAYKNAENWRYQEYWSDAVEIFDNIVPEKYKADKRADLGILIDKRPLEDDIQSVVSIGGIINSIVK